MPSKPLSPVLLVLLLLHLSQLLSAFYPDADDVNMDFLKKDSNAGPDMERLMLMNTEDPKLRAEAEEAFQEILRARRLSKLQVCRRECVNEHEAAAEFASCNAKCEATHPPGEYEELPTLRGSTDAGVKKPVDENADKVEKNSDEQQAEKPRASGEL